MADLPGTPRPPSGHTCSHGHVVEFYDSEEFLADTVAGFLGEGCEAGEAGLVVATPTHREAFVAALGARGVDVRALVAQQRLQFLDAAETLGRFMTSEGPDAGRFRATVGAALDALATGGRRPRVYGEMVAVLWADGDHRSAIALEDLWNDLATERAFALLCAYPLRAFEDPESAESFARVCDAHTSVIPGDDYARLEADEIQRRRVVAGLQQEVLALRHRLGRAEGRGAAVADLARVDALADVTDPGAPARARARARAVARGAVAPPGAAAPSLPRRRAGDAGVAQFAERLLDALRAGDTMLATEVMRDCLAAGLSPAEVFARVLAPAMHEIGEAWAERVLTIADEHLATVTAKRAIAAVYPATLTCRPRSRERVLVAGVEGERHALAPRIVADVLDGLGYDVVHLGADVPVDALVASVTRFEPALVALSVTMPLHQAALERSLAAVQRQRPDMLFLLGGQGIAPRWQASGVPVAETVEDAGRLAESLLAARPRMPRLAARPFAVTATIRPADDDRVTEVAAVAGDLAEIAREHALRAHEYRFLALEDPLTGLPNRRAFDDRFEQAIAGGDALVMLVVDVDGFKTVNDVHGHDAGDELLIRIGRAIVAAVRPGDLVARLGGDEFGILLAGAGDVEADALAERVRRSVEADCAALGATVSVGGARFEGDRRLTALEADRALYLAKSRGRNAVALGAA